MRAKIGCRYIDELPTTAEGVLGGGFYKFQCEVEEVLVRNPVSEEKVVPVMNDKAPRTDHTPKRKRGEVERKDTSRSPAADNAAPSSHHMGKTCRLSSPEKDVSISSESGADSSLFIEKLARENDDHVEGTEQNTAIIPVDPGVLHVPVDHATAGSQNVQVQPAPCSNRSLSYLEVVTNVSQVMEIDRGGGGP